MLKTGLYPHWLLILILIITAAAYSLGLDSRFLLDDFPNLSSLEDVERSGYLHYIFINNSGPSGRPVSLLSFALQYGDWPNNPQAFKTVNLLIHLLNGILIYLITLTLSRFIRSREVSSKWLALIVASLWLMHPIHVNTVLYVVQRMALLATLFTLAGIIIYLKLWEAENPSASIKRLFIGSILYTGCVVLAVFSKENGILLPLFILTIEFTLLAYVKRPPLWRIWAGIFLLLPLIISVFYLAAGFSAVVENYSIRSYSMAERLMTEARVIMIYLKHLLIPHPSAFSLFHDDFSVSRGLLSPPTTLYSIIVITLTLIGGFIWRRKMPIMAFGILWFSAAHLLESTYLNLELYFEHRNYLASYGVMFLVVTGMFRVRTLFNNQRVPDALFVTVYLAVTGVAISEITLWSRPVEQALEWQRRSPQSARALSEVGYLYLYLGEYDKAISTFKRINRFYPYDIYPYIKKMSINTCFKGEPMDAEQWHELLTKASQARWYGGAPISQLDQTTKTIENGGCQDINIYALIQLTLILAKNPEFARHRAQLHELAALLNSYIGEMDAAINNANQAVKERPSPQRYFLKIRFLLEAGRYQEASDTMSELKERYDKRLSFHLAYDEYINYYDKKLENLSK